MYTVITDTAVRNAKPKHKPYKLAHERGMYLLVTPLGGKYWRLDYRFQGKRKTAAMGIYPEISLKQARERRDEARKQLANGIDPTHARKVAKRVAATAAVSSFEAVAREWFGKFSRSWAAAHSEKVIRRLEKNAFPWLGARPIAEITPPELLSVLRRIESTPFRHAAAIASRSASGS